MACLNVRRLTFSYGAGCVLNGVSLNLAAGETLGVIGPNGSGKSTLIRAISRTLPLKAGSVSLDDRDLCSLSRSQLARQIAVVPQNPNLPEAFTAAEIVIMGRTPHLSFLQPEGLRDLEVVERAMVATDTWSLAARRIGELSGGERQRVVLARALAQEPQVLLLDEPTAHLDINYQVALLDLVNDLKDQQGLGVLLVLHDLNLAAQYCQRLLLLNRGEVFAQGGPAEVITEANINAVYGTHVRILPHPDNLLPTTIIVPGDGKFSSERLGKILKQGGV